MRRALAAAYLRQHGARYGAGIALLVATNALALSIPWMLKQAVEAIGRHAPYATVAGWAGVILVVAVAQAGVRTWSRLYLLGTARLVAYDLRQRLFAAFSTLSPAWYDHARTGDLMSRAVNDMQLVRSLFGPGVMNLVNTVLAYAGSVAVMAWIDWRLTLVSLVPYPFVLLAMNRLSRALFHRSTEAQEHLATLSSRAQENLSGMQQVKAFVREEAEIEEFSAMAADYRRANLALARVRGGMVPLMGSIGGIGTLVVLWLGGRHIAAGRMTLGDFVAFSSYLAGLAWPTLAMGWILNVFQRGMGGLDRIGEILAQAPAAQAGASEALPHAPGVSVTPRMSPQGPPPAIDIRNLTFAYDAGGRAALSNVTLSIPAGATVGIVGPVGSGKSTLLALVAGLYPAPPGTIFVDGRDLTAIPPDDWRSRLALVPQESFLFSRSIAENIALGRPEASRASIERAAELARLSEDRGDFPDGYDSIVGERGITLSGGQRQRAALARALLLDPPLLLLDDTLSAVDARVEAAIKENLHRFRGRTCLVAASRLSAIAGADHVLVLDGGRVVESGPPAVLAAAGGLYARMARRQQLEDLLESA